MKVVSDKITLKELEEMSLKMFNHFVKAVVDIEKEIMVLDADLHADEEMLLLENGSSQQNLWGINLYPEQFDNDDFIEFDSMINIRPSWGNCSGAVENNEIQKIITKIIQKLVVV